MRWCAASDAGLPRPDLVLFLTLGAAETQKRGGYGQERYEEANFQNKVEINYSKLKCDNWRVVETDGKSIDELQAELLAIVATTVEEAKSKQLQSLPWPEDIPIA